MSDNPACCGSDASVHDAAQLMVEHDCGEFPVVDSERRPVRLVADRDIACCGVAESKGAKTPASMVPGRVTPEPEGFAGKQPLLLKAQAWAGLPP